MPKTHIDPNSGLLMTRAEFFEAQGREDPFPGLAARDVPPYGEPLPAPPLDWLNAAAE